jgi:hypothetical protein
MKTKQILLLLSVIATVSSSAKEPKPPHGRRPPTQALLGVLDANHDGRLSKKEITNSSNLLGDHDKNDDGAHTYDELMPRPPKGKKDKTPPLGKRPPLLIATLDLDEDGTISGDEIEAAPVSLLTLGKNEYGVLSRKELNPGKGKGPHKPE